MHDLHLSTTLPASRHNQLLHILTGLSAHQPLPILELVLVARPPSASISKRATADTKEVGAQQSVGVKKARTAEKGGDGRFVRIVGSVHLDEDEEDDIQDGLGARTDGYGATVNGSGIGRDTDGDTDMGTDSTSESIRMTLTARTSDIPAPNITTHNSRSTILHEKLGTASALSDAHEKIMEYLRTKSLLPVAAYAIVGARWTYARYVDVRLYRIVVSTKLEAAGTRDENEIARGAMAQLSALATGLNPSSLNSVDAAMNPSLDPALTPLDKSNACLLSADVTVDDPPSSTPQHSQQSRTHSQHTDEETNTDAISRNEEARSMLLGFKDRLRGVVDLRAVERLALDSRIKA